jgi:hypothetical protein
MNPKTVFISSLTILGVTVMGYGVYLNFQYARQADRSSAQTPITYPEETATPTAEPTAVPTSEPTSTPTPAPNTTQAPTATPTPTTQNTTDKKRGDITNDNKVNLFDLSAMLSKWGTDDDNADLNNNNNVDAYDLSILLSKWEN